MTNDRPCLEKTTLENYDEALEILESNFFSGLKADYSKVDNGDPDVVHFSYRTSSGKVNGKLERNNDGTADFYVGLPDLSSNQRAVASAFEEILPDNTVAQELEAVAD